MALYTFRGCILFFVLSVTHTISVSQIAPPGHEEHLRAVEQMRNISVLDRDSVTTRDTVVIFDPGTYEQRTEITVNTWSIRDYCQHVLGVNDPDRLLEGDVIEITDPVTYDKLKVRWNATAGKIDTLH